MERGVHLTHRFQGEEKGALVFEYAPGGEGGEDSIFGKESRRTNGTGSEKLWQEIKETVIFFASWSFPFGELLIQNDTKGL